MGSWLGVHGTVGLPFIKVSFPSRQHNKLKVVYRVIPNNLAINVKESVSNNKRDGCTVNKRDCMWSKIFHHIKEKKRGMGEGEEE